jgi:hypothetical protein
MVLSRLRPRNKPDPTWPAKRKPVLSARPGRPSKHKDGGKHKDPFDGFPDFRLVFSTH